MTLSFAWCISRSPTIPRVSGSLSPPSFSREVSPANCAPSVPRAELISPLSPLSPPGPPTPLPPPPPPGLPTYEQALAASGVHDAPPPPYTRCGAGFGPEAGRRGAGTAGGGAWARGRGFWSSELITPGGVGARGRGPALGGGASEEGGACAQRVRDWPGRPERVGKVWLGEEGAERQPGL